MCLQPDPQKHWIGVRRAISLHYNLQKTNNKKKTHTVYQSVCSTTVPFSDKKMARIILSVVSLVKTDQQFPLQFLGLEVSILVPFFLQEKIYPQVKSYLCFRLWRWPEALSSMLVHVFWHLFEVGLLWLLALAETAAVHHHHGPVCWPHHHHLHRSQHRLYGHGALSNDRKVWGAAQHWKSGEWWRPNNNNWKDKIS